MRLTLRTLLAYLDDMLNPAETRTIGQKVAESQQAQELIARIQQVTRRRRLGTPPATGPGAFDPNTVAEYLDNTLSVEQLEEVEKTCLESDVHLAEIVVNHQILALVLGQSALVPPTAKQRMYALVRGQEAIPGRRVRTPPTTREVVVAQGDKSQEDDDSLLPGLRLTRAQAAWLRWLLPVAGVLLVVVLGLIFWHVFPWGPDTSMASRQDTGEQGGASPENQVVALAPEQLTVPPILIPTEQAPAEVSKPGSKPAVDHKPNDSKPGETKPGETKPGETKPGETKPGPEVILPGIPSKKERREVGRFFPNSSAPSVLVSRPLIEEPWLRLSANGKVFTSDILVSLPGYHSDLRLDSGVIVTLWGSLPELVPAPLLESAAVLNPPAAQTDADLTLDRGAWLITNRKEKQPARVRVRFHDQVWDLTLAETGAQVGLVLWGRLTTPYNPARSEGPEAVVFLFIFKGPVTVKLGSGEHRNLQGTPVPTFFFWDNKGTGIQGPMPLPENDPFVQAFVNVWSKPQVDNRTRQVNQSLDEMSLRLTANKPVAIALVEALQAPESIPPLQRILAIRCLGALDVIPDLLDALGDEQKSPQVRAEVINSLRHWIGRNESQELKLYDPLKGTGFLVAKKYREVDARTFMSLLHTFSEADRKTPDLYSWLIKMLLHDKLAIRELAYWHLVRLAPAGMTIPYDAADTAERRQKAYDQWRKLIPEGQLPPPSKENGPRKPPR